MMAVVSRYLCLLMVLSSPLLAQRAGDARAGVVGLSVKSLKEKPTTQSVVLMVDRKLVGMITGIGVGVAIVAVRHTGGNGQGVGSYFLVDPAIIIGCMVLGGVIAAATGS